MRTLLVKSLAVIGATAVGLAVFLLTLGWPTFFFRAEIMLLWGWIGGILGIWTGYKSGGYAYALVVRALLKPSRLSGR
jgi:hypothetical protein